MFTRKHEFEEAYSRHPTNLPMPYVILKAHVLLQVQVFDSPDIVSHLRMSTIHEF